MTAALYAFVEEETGVLISRDRWTE